jgi:hypothetical protein
VREIQIDVDIIVVCTTKVAAYYKRSRRGFGWTDVVRRMTSDAPAYVLAYPA